MNRSARLAVLFSPLSIAQSFVMEGLNRKDIRVIPFVTRRNKVCKLLYYFFLKLKLYYLASFFRFHSDLRRQIKNANNILLFDCSNLDGYFVVNSLLKPTAQKTIFFWNPLLSMKKDKEYIKNKLIKLSKLGYRLTTFDPGDSKEYKMTLIKNVDRRVDIKTEVSPEYDFYFIGKTKGREKIIAALKRNLSSKGYKLNFIVINSYKDAITPLQNIYNSANSKCIVDIVSPIFCQTGLTLRPFDALFLNRKVITNASNIIECDFYNPNNIYVIKDENLDGIESFMNLPYQQIDSKIVNSYEINNWINQFL